MISSKSRLKWIKWHAYLSCFFLPLALIYALSGLLDLLGVEDGPSTRFEIAYIENNRPMDVWPTEEVVAKAAVVKLLSTKEHKHHLPLPDQFFVSKDWRGWYGISQEVQIIAATEKETAKVIIEKNGFMRQLMYIHKGIAGDIFKTLSILLGISLLFSLISGAVVALNIPKMKNNSLLATTFGAVVLIAAYLFS